MKKHIIYIILYILLVPQASQAAVRIKDIVEVEGVRDNHLIGYGLVVGLNGTGDNLNNSVFTQKGLTDFLERLGVNTRGANLKTKNVAAVTITASLPPFAHQGTRIDVSVSTLGDAKSLQGGTLLATPLLGADGEVYAVAQGQVSLGGFTAAGKSGTSINKGVSTNGFIPNGAIIEKEIDFDFSSMNKLKLSLRNPDISTALNIAQTIDLHIGGGIAKATDPGTVELTIPARNKDNIVAMLGEIEKLTVEPDQNAKIVIDESSGTIVMGENVTISPVAVAQGNLTVTVSETPQVSQPGALSGGATAVTPQTKITADEDKGKKMEIIENGSTLKDLVNGLNALGVGPRDLINILQTIKSAGALQADIETK
jgi:flagellar P-ring protein precursor FlgI